MAKKRKKRAKISRTQGSVPDIAETKAMEDAAVVDDTKSDEITKLVQLAVQETVTIHAGPLPSPDALAKYEETLPGLADRIVSMAEREASHRHNTEKKEQRLLHRLQGTGQISGIGIVGACLALVFLEKPGAAGVAIAALVALAGVFVFSKLSARREQVARLPRPD